MHPLAATQLRRKAREIKAMAARLRDSGRVNMAQLESAYAHGILHAVRVFASATMTRRMPSVGSLGLVGSAMPKNCSATGFVVAAIRALAQTPRFEAPPNHASVKLGFRRGSRSWRGSR